MILHCPCCHAHYSIEALTQDEAARELLGMRATLPPSMLGYLALFRGDKRALSWDKALKLTKEALALAEPSRLETALAVTVESLRQKRDEGAPKPLKNHNYLKRVLESTPAVSVPESRITVPESRVPNPEPRLSKTATAIGALEEWKG